MAEAPAAYVAHAMPGRVRLRLPTLRGDMARLPALALAVAGLPRVATAEASAATGSLLIRHEGPLEEFLADAAAAGLFVLRPAVPPGDEAPLIPTAALLPVAGAAAAAGLTVVQLLRREALPPALTLGWHAVSLAQIALRRGLRMPASR